MNRLTRSLLRAAVALPAICAAASVAAQPTSGVSPVMSVIGVEPDEPLTPGLLAGGLLIVLSVALTTLRRRG